MAATVALTKSKLHSQGLILRVVSRMCLLRGQMQSHVAKEDAYKEVSALEDAEIREFLLFQLSHIWPFWCFLRVAAVRQQGISGKESLSESTNNFFFLAIHGF